jgi:hypothetical protein
MLVCRHHNQNPVTPQVSLEQLVQLRAHVLGFGCSFVSPASRVTFTHG